MILQSVGVYIDQITFSIDIVMLKDKFYEKSI